MTATSSLDNLAKLAAALGHTPLELAAVVGVSTNQVNSWIEGTARPGERNRARLAALVAAKLEWARNGRVAQSRQAALQALVVALQSPAERQAWLAKRAEIRARYGR